MVLSSVNFVSLTGSFIVSFSNLLYFLNVHMANFAQLSGPENPSGLDQKTGPRIEMTRGKRTFSFCIFAYGQSLPSWPLVMATSCTANHIS